MSEINSKNLHVEVDDLTKHVTMNNPDSAAIRDQIIDKDLKSVEISNTSSELLEFLGWGILQTSH